MDTATRPATPPAPTISIAFLKKVKKIGRDSMQEWLGFSDAEFVATVKSHAVAVLCHANPELAEAIRYETSYAGDTRVHEWM